MSFEKPVCSISDGLVTKITISNNFGTEVIVQDKFTQYFVYSHLSRTNLTLGMFVQVGDVIGYRIN